MTASDAADTAALVSSDLSALQDNLATAKAAQAAAITC